MPDALLIASVDWVVVSSLATAAGTLVLAVATFAAVRSANRSAKTTERALLAGLRPVLMGSRFDDPMQKVGFQDQRWLKVEGGRAAAEATDEAIYLVMSLRNVGAGLAVLDRWDFWPERNGAQPPHAPDAFRRLTRDIYVAPNDIGFWQGAFRDRDDPMFTVAQETIRARRGFTIDLLYGDHEGGQRTITRFGVVPAGDDAWLASVSKHWNLDRDDPR